MVAVFLRPDPDKVVYYQYAVTAGGVRFDQKIDGGLRLYDLDQAWEAAATRHTSGWQVEMRIPFKSLGVTEQAGKKWALNFCRSRQADKQTSAWAPVKTWHDYVDFGLGRGILIVPENTQTPLTLQAAEFSEITSAGNPLLTLSLNNRQPDSFPGKVEIKTIAPSGEAAVFETDFIVPGQAPLEIVVPFKITAEKGFHKITFTLRGTDGKEIYNSPVMEFRNRNEASIYLTRDYYTTEKQATLIYQLCQPAAGAIRTLGNTDSSPVQQTFSDMSRMGRMEIDLTELPTGEYPLEVSFQDAAGVTFAAEKLILKKLTPLTDAQEVKLDQEKRILLVNDRPFFPLAPVMIQRLEEYDVATISRLGFNSMIHWTQRYHIEQEKRSDYYFESLDQIYGWAEQYGLYVIDNLTHYGFSYSYNDAENMQKKFMPWLNAVLPEIMTKTRHHPRTLFYMSFDEPNLAAKYNQGAYDILDYCKQAYDKLKELDPYHPVWLNFSGLVPPSEEWSRAYDIVSIDPYWLPFYGQTIDYVAKNTEAANTVARQHGKFLMIILCYETFGGSARGLTPAEQRCQSYLAIIMGARGLGYFYYPIKNQALLEASAALNREITELAPVILEHDLQQEIVCLPKGQPCPLAILTKRYAGKTYLITANYTAKEVAVWLKPDGLPNAAGTVKVLFEDRHLLTEARGFKDVYAPLQTHVYEVDGMQDIPGDKARLELTIELPGSASVAAPAAVMSESSPIVVQDNLLENPDIEQGLKGWHLYHFKDSSAEGKADTAIRHTGQQSLMIRKNNRGSASHFRSKALLLETNTAYLAGGFVKAAIYEGFTGPKMFVRFLSVSNEYLRDEMIAELEGRGVANPSGEIDWTEVCRTITTGSEPVKAQIWCSLYESIGDAWFDDLYLVKQKSGIAEPAIVASNMLGNSSFEQTANPGWPDGWIPRDCWWETSARFIMLGEEGCLWGTDTAEAMHGQQSFRLAVSEKHPVISAAAHKISIKGGREYTLSVYAKADNPQVRASLRIMNHHYRSGAFPHIVSETFIPGETWKRYVFTVKLDPGQTIVSPSIFVSGSGTAWFDAVRFEEGTEALPYDVPAEIQEYDTVRLRRP